jgi:hypothetical protein
MIQSATGFYPNREKIMTFTDKHAISRRFISEKIDSRGILPQSRNVQNAQLSDCHACTTASILTEASRCRFKR